MNLQEDINLIDSGVDWIGLVPRDWEIKKIKYLFKIVNGSTPKSGDPDNWDGDIIWITPDDLGKIENSDITDSMRRLTQEGYDSCGTEKVPNGTIVLSTRAPIGHLGIADQELCTNQGCKSLVPLSSINSEYYYYLLIGGKQELQSLGQGATFTELATTKLAGVKLTIPPNKIQNKIAHFLNIELQQLIEIVSKYQQFIELLKEKRIALISHVVTKGLDPDVKMKDSGVEWIGEIPERWEVKRLKYISSIKGRIGFRGYRSEDLVPMGEGALTIVGKHIDDNNYLDLHEPEYLSWDKYYESPEIMVKINDLIICQRGTLGKVAIIDKDIGEATINPSMILLKDSLCNPKYLYYLLTSIYISNYIEMITSKTAVPMISQQQVGNITITIPPDNDQGKIIDYLDQQTSKIDNLMEKINKQIDLLNEYKTSLISHAVTGKIDVRGVV